MSAPSSAPRRRTRCPRCRESLLPSVAFAQGLNWLAYLVMQLGVYLSSDRGGGWLSWRLLDLLAVRERSMVERDQCIGCFCSGPRRAVERVLLEVIAERADGHRKTDLPETMRAAADLAVRLAEADPESDKAIEFRHSAERIRRRRCRPDDESHPCTPSAPPSAGGAT